MDVVRHTNHAQGCIIIANMNVEKNLAIDVQFVGTQLIIRRTIPGIRKKFTPIYVIQY